MKNLNWPSLLATHKASGNAFTRYSTTRALGLVLSKAQCRGKNPNWFDCLTLSGFCTINSLILSRLSNCLSFVDSVGWVVCICMLLTKLSLSLPFSLRYSSFAHSWWIGRFPYQSDWSNSMTFFFPHIFSDSASPSSPPSLKALELLFILLLSPPTTSLPIKFWILSMKIS